MHLLTKVVWGLVQSLCLNLNQFFTYWQPRNWDSARKTNSRAAAPFGWWDYRDQQVQLKLSMHLKNRGSIPSSLVWLIQRRKKTSMEVKSKLLLVPTSLCFWIGGIRVPTGLLNFSPCIGELALHPCGWISFLTPVLYSSHHYPQLVTMGEDKDMDWVVNKESCPKTELMLHHHSLLPLTTFISCFLFPSLVDKIIIHFQ